MTRQTLFDKKVRLDPGQIWYMTLEVKQGDEIHIVAKETYGDTFDVYIVPPENVRGDDFRTDYALLTHKSRRHFRGSYTFKEDGSYCVVVGNYGAKSVEREVYVKMTLETNAFGASAAEGAGGQAAHPIDTGGRRWKGAILLAVILGAWAFLAYLASLVSIFLGGFVVTAGAILLDSFKKEIRRMLGAPGE